MIIRKTCVINHYSDEKLFIWKSCKMHGIPENEFYRSCGDEKAERGKKTHKEASTQNGYI